MENEMDIVARYAAETPVNLNRMFEALGIEYQEAWIDDDKSAWIEHDGDRFTVVVNALEPEVRQRFSAAHELAHYLLHRDMLDDGGRVHRHEDRLYGGRQANPASPFEPIHEVQANRLAAQIIMPAQLVRQKWAQIGDLGAMAKEFRVSKAAMQIRLTTLGLAA